MVRRRSSRTSGGPQRSATRETVISTAVAKGGRVYWWLIGAALLIAALSLLFPSTPSYDPWAWIVWGREILHGTLHTAGGPTWKPLPALFTTVFALFGRAAPDLWLVVARAGAIVAVLMAFKLSYRVTQWLGARAAAALLASVIAVVALVLAGDFLSNSALGYSEGMCVAALLIGLERHLDGRPHQAFIWGFIAALDRPEIWLFWGPYGLWLAWKQPEYRRLVFGLAVLTVLVWFVPQQWGGGSLTSGVSRAQQPLRSSAAFAPCPFCSELSHHAWFLVPLRVKLAAFLAMIAAAITLVRARAVVGNRGRALVMVLLCGAFGFGWWVLIAIETQAGFSGNDRYLVIGSAFIDICGAIGYGWAAVALGEWIGKRLPRALPQLTGVVLMAVVFVAVPGVVTASLISLPRTRNELEFQAHLRTDLSSLITRAGGAPEVNECAAGYTTVERFQLPMLAWYLDTRLSRLQIQPKVDAAGEAIPPQPWPSVIFQDRSVSGSGLRPEPRTISDWERAGANYAVRRMPEMTLYEDCLGRSQLAR